MPLRIQCEPFCPGFELDRFRKSAGGAGAMVSFTGIVRPSTDGKLKKLLIEHYPGMTDLAIASMQQEAGSRWGLKDSLVIHRFGELAPGEDIMMVATLSDHRREAFAAAEFLMDFLKSRAPFWKKEITESGEHWVESLEEDERALKRWIAD